MKALALFSLCLICTFSSPLLAASYKFKVSTYNVRNFAQIDDQPSPFKPVDGPTSALELRKNILAAKSDIMVFQEIINGSLFEEVLSKVLPNHHTIITECGGTADQKIILAYDYKKFQLERSEEEWRVALSTRCNYGLRPALIAWLKHKITKKKIAVITVHLKAGSGDRNRATRRDQHQVLSQVLNDLARQNLNDVIVLGDFNTTSFYEQTPGAVQFENFLKENALKNTTAAVRCTSYWQGDVRGDNTMSPSHLDHILHIGSARVLKANSLAHCARQVCKPSSANELGTSFTNVSDHCPVQVEFSLSR